MLNILLLLCGIERLSLVILELYHITHYTELKYM